MKKERSQGRFYELLLTNKQERLEQKDADAVGAVDAVEAVGVVDAAVVTV